jgi:hypothetical protein
VLTQEIGFSRRRAPAALPGGFLLAIRNGCFHSLPSRLLRPTFSLKGGFCSTPGGRFAGCFHSLVAGRA